MAENVDDMSVWSGMLKDLFRQIDDGSITKENIQAFLEHRNPFDAKEERYITIVDDGKEKTSEIIAKMRKLFSVWVYNEEKIDKQFPTPEKPISRKFLLTQEADIDLKNKSANDLEKEGIAGITLRERLIYELEYFKRTGQHLDVKNITLCAGLRYTDGDVPGIRWLSDLLRVGWLYPSTRSDDLRSRREV
ncbi:MAG: hypothetical protein V1732_04390 [Patescibacteria group bacterium]